ncbi:FAD:protein FMN transferase [Cryobacterium sp. MLB-32]|uniref:FAD:protein FMN transferase n=1 Tax=Cryobacterium sp. MLB-32 TaxID=1529318 RepID=UPI0009DCFDC3|nr:FAD:protein FMN transferase [Cryobacterium sp. MLB-32]
MAVAAQDWELWSTTARLVVTDAALLGAARSLADVVLADIEGASSRFNADSELRRVTGELTRGVEVSDTLAGLVRHALGAAASTDGLVDPTLGRAVSAAGYDRDIRLIEDDHTVFRAVSSARPGWKSVSVVGNTLRVPRHRELDLGATAKAVAADTIAATVRRELGCGVLVSLGGDIATAGPAPEGGWQVLVRDSEADPAARVTLREGMAVATSSTQGRRWLKNGRAQHHILNPRTGVPVEPVWRTVTIAATSCLDANTLSTAAIVCGSGAVQWLRARGACARLVHSDGDITVLGGWPAEHPVAVSVAVGVTAGVRAGVRAGAPAVAS